MSLCPTYYEREKIWALAQQRAVRFGESLAFALVKEFDIWLADARQAEEDSDANSGER